MMSQLKLKLTDVEVKYGEFTALSGIHMDVHEGELVVLLGANGAGKSTIFRTISGLNKLSKGEIHFMGNSERHIPDKLVKRSQCAEGESFFRKCQCMKT